MCLGLDADNTLYVANHKVIAGAVVLRSKLLYDGTLCKCYIIFICRDNLVGILLRSLLNHLEEAALLLFAIDDERTTEDLMTAVLTVNLSKAEYLAVSKLAAQLLLYIMQILNLLW